MLERIGASMLPHAYAQLTAICPTSNARYQSQQGYFRALCPVTSDVPIGQLVDNIITLILYAAGALAVIYLLYSGILYITAGGDDTKATKARTGIVNAVIGIIIIILAFVIEKAAARLFA